MSGEKGKEGKKAVEFDPPHPTTGVEGSAGSARRDQPTQPQIITFGDDLKHFYEPKCCRDDNIERTDMLSLLCPTYQLPPPKMILHSVSITPSRVVLPSGSRYVNA